MIHRTSELISALLNVVLPLTSAYNYVLSHIIPLLKIQEVI